MRCASQLLGGFAESVGLWGLAGGVAGVGEGSFARLPPAGEDGGVGGGCGGGGVARGRVGVAVKE